MGALQATPPPMTLDTPSSFHMSITRYDGSIVEANAFLDKDRRRAEFTANGFDLVVIMHQDENEAYGIFPAQKFRMRANISDSILDRYRAFATAFSAAQGECTEVGRETCEGVPCIKYSVTSAEAGQSYFLWYDPARQAPVKVAAANKRFFLTITDFKRGPQANQLFVVPDTTRDERYYTIPAFFPLPKGRAPDDPNPSAPASPSQQATPDTSAEDGMTPPPNGGQ